LLEAPGEQVALRGVLGEQDGLVVGDARVPTPVPDSDIVAASSAITGDAMASLVIRDLDDDVKTKLRIRAAENGRSMEAEARAILTAAVAATRPARGLGSYIRNQVSELGGVDLEVPPRDESPRVADLS
jgi:plasmid stability protein